MVSKKYLLFQICLGMLLMLIPGYLKAQGQVAGHIPSAKKMYVDGYVTEHDSLQTVDFASVRLFSLPDSTFKGGVVTKEKGKFVIAVPQAGKYFLQFSSVGYQTVRRELVVTPAGTPVHLGRVSFPPDATQLEAVEIVVQIPPVVQQGDTTTYNAAAFNVAEGSALEDLLKKLPGATLDEDNNLLVNGQKITKVLMDGQEYMMGDLNTMMKDIPAEMVDKLKVYHRKSKEARTTGVDDGKEDLVLDLKVKPNMKKGWNGELMAGIRNDKQYQGKASLRRFTDKKSFSANYNTEDDGITKTNRLSLSYMQRSDKFDISGNANANMSDRNSWRETSKESFITDSTSEYSYSKSDNISKSKSLSASLNMEWRPDSATTITFRPQVNLTKGDTNSRSLNESLDTNHNPINHKESARPEHSNGFSTRGELYVNRRFGKVGRNLSLRLNYYVSKTNRDGFFDSQTQYQKYGDSVFVQRQKIFTDDRSKELSANVTYTEPLFTGNYLRLEYSYRYKLSDYQRSTYEWIDSLGYYDERPDSASSRFTTSRYNIHQGAISWVGNVKEKLSYTLGLRMETQKYRNLNYFEESTVSDQARTVTNYFPNFNLTYRFSKNSSLRMNYSGRSSQPSLNDLQPTTDNTDPLNIKTGNPNLSSSFSNSVSGQYSLSFPKTRSSVNANFNYGNIMNKVAWLVDYNPETGVRTNSPRNVNGDWNMGGSLAYYTPLGKANKFSIQTNSSFRYNNRIGFSTVGREASSTKTYTRSLNLVERLRGSFRTKKYSVDASFEVNYNNTTYSMRPEANHRTFDYVVGLNADLTLPFDIRWSSSANWRFREGYSGNNNRTKKMLNLQLSRAFLKKKNVILRFNLYDILQTRDNSGRTVGETYVSDWSSSSSDKIYMFSITYKFNKYGTKRKTTNKKGSLTQANQRL